jgi:hypothetical protein
MTKIVEVEGVGNVEFPDDMSDDQIGEAIRAQVGGPKPVTQPPSNVQRRNFAGVVDYDFDATKSGNEGHESVGGKIAGQAKQGLKALAETGLGVGKGAIGTLYHIGKFIGAVPENKDFEAALESENALQTTGKVAENVGEFAAGEGFANAALKATGAAAKLQAASAGARTLAKVVKGAAVGAGVTAAEGGDPKMGAFAGGAGGAVSGAIEDVAPAVLKAGARKSYAQFLGAAGKADKVRTQDIVDEALSRGIKGSLGEVAKTADEAKAGAAQSLDDLYAQHAGETVPASDITTHLDDAEKAYVGVNATTGKPNVYGPEAKKAVKVIRGLKKVIDGATDSSGEVDIGELRKIRRAWYDVASGASDTGYAGGAQNLTQKIHKQAAAGIAEVLNSELPDVAAVNKEYTFWKKFSKVANNTLLRKSSQEVPMSERIVQGAVMGGDLATHGVASAIIKGEAARQMMAAVRSGAWRSTSAVFRNNLANAIAAGKVGTVTQMLRGLSVAGASAATQ